MSQGFYGFPRILDIVRATTFKALGKVGATNGAALAGGTASGAPTAPAGPFDVGDVIVDASGKLWICTTAGTSQSSPGSFTQVGGTTSPLSTKGDVWVYGSADARLGVGSNDQVLLADSTQSLGLRWGASPAGAGGALTQLAQSVLSGSAASVTFSSISGSYSALKILYLARTTSGNAEDDLTIQFNGDSGSNYRHTYVLASTGSVTSSESGAESSAVAGAVTGGGAPSGYAAMGEITLPAYAGTTLHKVGVALSMFRGAAAGGNLKHYNQALHWLSTAAITSVLLQPASGSFAAGSQFTLYGLS